MSMAAGLSSPASRPMSMIGKDKAGAISSSRNNSDLPRVTTTLNVNPNASCCEKNWASVVQFIDSKPVAVTQYTTYESVTVTERIYLI